MADAPTFTYWHVWTDNDGVSRQTRCTLNSFDRESMGGDADPQWNRHLLTAGAHILFSELPAGWTGEWHENPKPQWIVPLSGRWFVETMDGTRVEMGPGELSFGADQHTRADAEGRTGHRSGTVGDAPCRMMIVQLHDEKLVGARPGVFDTPR